MFVNIVVVEISYDHVILFPKFIPWKSIIFVRQLILLWSIEL
jgi:hypothetical protein